MIQRKTISFLLTILLILAGSSVVVASVYLYYEMPMSATIVENPAVEMYLGDNPWTNGTNVGWGIIERGTQNMKSLDIHNVGNLDLQVVAVVTGLPQNWDLTYNRNGSIVHPGNWLNGTITLIVPSNASFTSYSWTLGFSFS